MCTNVSAVTGLALLLFLTHTSLAATFIFVGLKSIVTNIVFGRPVPFFSALACVYVYVWCGHVMVLACFCVPVTVRLSYLEVLSSLLLNTQVFWRVTPCSWVNTFRRFETSQCLHRTGQEKPCDCCFENVANYFSKDAVLHL